MVMLMSYLTDRDARAAAHAREGAHGALHVVATVLTDVLLDLGRVAAAADGLERGGVRLGAARVSV